MTHWRLAPSSRCICAGKDHPHCNSSNQTGPSVQSDGLGRSNKVSCSHAETRRLRRFDCRHPYRRGFRHSFESFRGLIPPVGGLALSGRARAVRRPSNVLVDSVDESPSPELRPMGPVSDAKALQSRKLRQIGDALVHAGLVTLEQQAQALGLCRSTAWTILVGQHKASGLSAAIINRMLSSPQLPPTVRARVLEYIDERVAGHYGHSKARIRAFAAQIRMHRAWFPGSLRREGRLWIADSLR
jgi:hypothetical protein